MYLVSINDNYPDLFDNMQQCNSFVIKTTKEGDEVKIYEAYYAVDNLLCYGDLVSQYLVGKKISSDPLEPTWSGSI